MYASIDKREVEEISNLIYNLMHTDLAEMGYPPDEYDSEAAELIKWYRSSAEAGGDQNAIAKKLRSIFSQNFESDYAVELFIPVQGGIENLLVKYEAIRNNLK